MIKDIGVFVVQNDLWKMENQFLRHYSKKSQKDEDRIFVIQRWQEKAEENGPECDTKWYRAHLPCCRMDY